MSQGDIRGTRNGLGRAAKRSISFTLRTNLIVSYTYATIHKSLKK